MQYKFTKKEIEDTIKEKLEELENWSYYDGVIVSIKPTKDIHDYIVVKGDLNKVVDMAAKIVAFVAECVKEVNPMASEEIIIGNIMNKAFSHKMKEQNITLKRKKKKTQ